MTASRGKRYQGDRFIANRSLQDLFKFKLKADLQDENTPYNNLVAEVLTGTSADKIAKINPYTQQSIEQFTPSYRVLAPLNNLSNRKSQTYESDIILKQSYQIRQIPIKDDFYRNTLDWQTNGLAMLAANNKLVAIKPSSNYRYQAFNFFSIFHIKSVKGLEGLNKTLAATEDNQVHLLDHFTSGVAQVFSIKGKGGHVLSQAKLSPHVMLAGTSVGMLYALDTRQKNAILISKSAKDYLSICGMSYCKSNNLLATGHNQNIAMLWDIRKMQQPRSQLTAHRAAVKAISFSPNGKYLATSGGTQDGNTIIWSTKDGSLLGSAHTGCQGSGTAWLDDHKLIATYGYGEIKLASWRFSPSKGLRKSYDEKINVEDDYLTRIFATAQNPKNKKEFATLGNYKSLTFFQADTDIKAARVREPFEDSKRRIRI